MTQMMWAPVSVSKSTSLRSCHNALRSEQNVLQGQQNALHFGVVCCELLAHSTAFGQEKVIVSRKSQVLPRLKGQAVQWPQLIKNCLQVICPVGYLRQTSHTLKKVLPMPLIPMLHVVILSAHVNKNLQSTNICQAIDVTHKAVPHYKAIAHCVSLLNGQSLPR